MLIRARLFTEYTYSGILYQGTDDSSERVKPATAQI